MTALTPRRMLAGLGILLAIGLLAAALFAFPAQTASAQTDDSSEEPSEEPTDDPSDDPSDDPTDDPSDDPSDDPTDEPSDEPTSGTNNPLLDSGIEELLTSDSLDADSLYTAFLQYLIAEYDTQIVVEDDTINIQIDLADLQSP